MAGIDLAVDVARIARPLDDQFDLPIVIQIDERPLKAVGDSDERHDRRHGNAEPADGQQSPRRAAKQVTPGDCREAHRLAELKTGRAGSVPHCVQL